MANAESAEADRSATELIDNTQRAIPVLEGDAPDTLAARVSEAERDAYPEAIRLFVDGRLIIQNGRLQIV